MSGFEEFIRLGREGAAFVFCVTGCGAVFASGVAAASVDFWLKTGGARRRRTSCRRSLETFKCDR